jgi:hypothetical protein
LTTRHSIHRQCPRRNKQELLNGSDDKRPLYEQNIKDSERAIKKAHRISGITFVVIPDVIVHKLGINEDTWFEEEVIDNGIILRKFVI